MCCNVAIQSKYFYILLNKESIRLLLKTFLSFKNESNSLTAAFPPVPLLQYKTSIFRPGVPVSLLFMRYKFQL